MSEEQDLLKNSEALAQTLTKFANIWIEYSSECKDSRNFLVSIKITEDPVLEYTSVVNENGNNNEVVVYVPQTYDIIPIIHECGHVIGCRRRDDIRLEYLCRMVIFWFVRDIYYSTYSNKQDQDSAFFNDTGDLLYNLVEPIDQCLINELKNRVKTSLKNVQERNDSKAFVTMQDNLFIICDETFRLLWDVSEEAYYYPKIHDEIKCTMRKMYSLYYLPDDNYYTYTRTDQCVQDVFKLFSEPIADCFMLHILDIGFEKYFDTLLDFGYRQISADSLNRSIHKELRSEWMNQELLSRLLSIYCNMECDIQNGSFSAKRYSPRELSKIEPLLSSKNRYKRSIKLEFREQVDHAISYLETRKDSTNFGQIMSADTKENNSSSDSIFEENTKPDSFYEDINRKIQTVLNPFDIIYDYIRVIYKDSRYDKLARAINGEQGLMSEKLVNLIIKIRSLVV